MLESSDYESRCIYLARVGDGSSNSEQLALPLSEMDRIETLKIMTWNVNSVRHLLRADSPFVMTYDPADNTVKSEASARIYQVTCHESDNADPTNVHVGRTNCSPSASMTSDGLSVLSRRLLLLEETPSFKTKYVDDQVYAGTP